MFSIIVASLNAQGTIGMTIESILSQTYRDFEIVVKDGGSKDRTLQNIPKDDKIKVYEQKDSSVYDGMNQALDYISGKFTIFMNCGDCFHDDYVLEKVAQMISDKGITDEEIIYGNYFKNNISHKQPSQIDAATMVKGGLCHQTVFVGRKVYEQVGRFDTTLNICADYDLMAKAFCNGVNYHYIDIAICDYEGGGISEVEEAIGVVKSEGNIIRKRYFSFAERAKYNFNRIKNRIGI